MADSNSSDLKAPARTGTDTVTTDGSIVHSNDPSTSPNATGKQKVIGDIKGGIHGTVGSMQAATGAMFRNKKMEEQGMEKMSEEDHRLAAKHGVSPVGSEKRETKVTENK